MASDEGLSVTLKRSESERYKGDGSWAVFHGSPKSIKQYMADFFGFDADDLTPAQTATEAERRWRAEDSTKLKPVGHSIVVNTGGQALKAAEAVEIAVKANRVGKITSEPVDVVVNALDGEVVSEEKTDDPWEDATPAVDGTPPWEEPKDPVIALIEAAGSKAEIQALYVQHKDEFQRPEVLEAAKKRTGEVDG